MVCGYPGYASVLHQSQGFDLERAVQTDQFDAFSFREGLDFGDGEDEPAPVAAYCLK